MLAAGASQRFGDSDKLKASLDGQPLIGHAATTLRNLPFKNHIAVCRRESTNIHRLLWNSGFEVVVNDYAFEGQSTSLRCAAQAVLETNAEGMMVALGDMPFVTALHLENIVAHLQPYGCVGSRRTDTQINMPPAAFHRTILSNLFEITGDYGAHRMLKDAPFVLCEKRELMDFDNPADFAKIDDEAFERMGTKRF